MQRATFFQKFCCHPLGFPLPDLREPTQRLPLAFQGRVDIQDVP
jgi:hypothetical protein